jgi:hypothetical protein
VVALIRKKKLQGMSMLDFFDMLFGKRIEDEMRKIIKEPEFQTKLKELAKNHKTLERIKEW